MVVIKERRRRSEYGYGHSRRGGGHIIFPFIMGGIIGFVGDMFYASLGLPGYKTPSSKCQALTHGDIYQVGGFAGLGLASLAIQSWTVASFSMGGLIGSLVPKALAANGFSRYGLFDFDSGTGTIKPKIRASK